MVMNFRVPENPGNFLTKLRTVRSPMHSPLSGSLSRRPHACHILCQSRPLFDHPGNITKLFTARFSPLYCHFLLPLSTSSSQHSVLKCPPSVYLPSDDRPTLTSTQNNTQNCIHTKQHFFQTTAQITTNNHLLFCNIPPRC
jgi:hypothetical protein